jgi:hypothetical protein
VNRDVVSQIWRRGAGRCEYCQLPARFFPAPFQIDHITARQHGGSSELSNLALSCLHCNIRKGPNLAGLDPGSGSITRLFHPRNDSWADHFEWHGPELTGRTAIGVVTIRVLGINEPDFRKLRAALMAEGVFQAS